MPGTITTTDLAIDYVKPTSSAKITVASPAFTTGEPIPDRYADYGDGVSPELSWSAAPEGTKSFVLMMEDPDAPEPKPYVHWLMYAIPREVTELPEGIDASTRLPDLHGAMQGRNSAGTIGHFGPRPPKTHPPHHYHFQVFALDAMLSLDPGVDRARLLSALKGHVLAAGQLIGTYQAR
jgi:Raf kinase inhibitor-like YbhB/YbcL family protein